MKRFHSPLQKIQRLQQQQLRLAEMAVLQARQAVADCQHRLQQLSNRSGAEQTSIHDRLQNKGVVVSLESMRSTFARQQLTAEQTDNERKLLKEKEQQVTVVEAAFKQLKARCQGTDDLLEKQIKEHRLDSFRKQQVDLEDGARSVSFVNRKATERNIQS